MGKNKPEYKSIIRFIDEMHKYSDEEILNKIEYIMEYLNKTYNYDVKYKFLILAIRTIKDLDTKTELIDKYLHFKTNSQHFYNWKLIKQILNDVNDEDIVKVFSKLFSNIKIKEVSKALDIPKNLKFGVELEYYNASFENIKSLYTSGMIKQIMEALSFSPNLINSLMKANFEKKNEFDEWVFSKEIDEDDLPEASSPIMTNSLNCLNQIVGIITLFNTFNAEVHGGTGLHINIGTDYFEDNIDALRYLLIIWGECEELFFKIANAENDIIRVQALNMATPIKENIQKTLDENLNIKLETDEDINRFMYNIQARNRLDYLLGFNHGDLEFELKSAKTEEDRYEVFKKYIEQKSEKDTSIRYTSLNFNHMTWNSKDKGRIEFRLFNSSLSSDVVVQNLLLVGKLCEISLKLASDPIYKREQFNELINHNVTEEEKLDLLLDLLFDNEDEKLIFKQRWSSVKDNYTYKRFRVGKETFVRGKSSYCLKKTITCNNL